jgi:hypothetical protein
MSLWDNGGHNVSALNVGDHSFAIFWNLSAHDNYARLGVLARLGGLVTKPMDEGGKTQTQVNSRNRMLSSMPGPFILAIHPCLMYPNNIMLRYHDKHFFFVAGKSSLYTICPKFGLPFF